MGLNTMLLLSLTLFVMPQKFLLLLPGSLEVNSGERVQVIKRISQGCPATKIRVVFFGALESYDTGAQASQRACVAAA